MKPFLIRITAAAIAMCAFTIAAWADYQVTIPTPTPSFDPADDSSNVIVTWTSTAPRFRLDSAMSFASGQLHSLWSTAIPRDSSIRIRCSRYPGVYTDVTPCFTNAPYTTVNVPLASTARFGLSGLAYQEVLPGDTITFEFHQNGPARPNLAEAEWLNVVINLEVYNPTFPTAEDLGILTNGVEIQNDAIAAGQVKWYKFRTLTDTLANRYLDIETSGSLDFVQQNTALGLYDEEGFRLFTDEDGGALMAAALSFAQPQAWGGRSAMYPAGMIRNGQDGNLPAGTYYLAVGPGGTGFQYSGFGVVNSSSATGTLRTTFVKGVDAAPAWPPAATDLGTLSGSGGFTQNIPVLSGHWYKIVLPQIQAPAWLDFDTEGTDDFLSVLTEITTSNSTVLGLYDAAGNVVASDGFDGTDSRALLSFGDSTLREYYHALRVGQDGNLAAGTYYLYLGGSNTALYPASALTNSWMSGPVNINARYCPPTKRSIAVDLDLEDWNPTEEGVVAWQLLDGPGGNVLEQGLAQSNVDGVFYALLNTTSGTGRVFTVKALHWLRAGLEDLNLNANVPLWPLTLINGDVDGDNEIGPGDFGELSSAFGSVPGDGNWLFRADLDGDEEVGPSDFGILSAHFGEAGY